jgi:hypothetical protein
VKATNDDGRRRTTTTDDVNDGDVYAAMRSRATRTDHVAVTLQRHVTAFRNPVP